MIIIVYWLIIGIGVMGAVDFELQRHDPDRWRGYTRGAGCVFAILGWPIIIVFLITAALAAVASR